MKITVTSSRELGNHAEKSLMSTLSTAAGHLVQVIGWFALRSSDSGMKWRHSSWSQSCLWWIVQYLTILSWQQTGQITPAWYFILFNQQNSLRKHSSNNTSCLRTSRAQKTSNESRWSAGELPKFACESSLSERTFPAWTTTSIMEEWHKSTTEQFLSSV